MKKNWFTIKKLKHNIWGIAEFEHFEKVISYLIVGKKRALLFDTGMGIGDIKKVVGEITSNPVVVLNSHSHYDHVGGNLLFPSKVNPEKEGGFIEIDELLFKVISTPGHTPDSICLYEENKGYLFSGDTLYPGPLYLQMPESDIGEFTRSIDRLRKLANVKRIFPAHNDFAMSPKLIEKVYEVLLKGNFKGKKSIQVAENVSLLLK